MENNTPRGLTFWGCAASGCTDTQAEQLLVGATEEGDGIDISDFEAGLAPINWNHVQADDKKVAPAQEIVGRVLSGRKILREEDCQNEFERQQWQNTKTPFVSVVCRLYDAAGHAGAQAIAAIMRGDHAAGQKQMCRLSVEGSTTHRAGNRLLSSVAKALAVTICPANRVCDTAIISDSEAPPGFDPSPLKEDGVDLLSDLVEKGEEFVDPLRTRLGQYETNYVVLNEETIQKSELETFSNKLTLILKSRLFKAISAGSYGSAPSSLSGGSSLQVEDRSLKARLRRAVTEYKPKGRFDKAEFKVIAKAYLPDCSDDYLNHFADIAQDYHVRLGKSEQSLPFESLLYKCESLIIDLRKSIDDLTKEPTVKFSGHNITPGHAIAHNQEYALLHEDDNHYYAIPQDKLNNHSHKDLIKLPKHQEGSHYTVSKRPSIPVAEIK